MKKIICSFLALFTLFIFSLPSFAQVSSDSYLNIHKNSKHLHSRLSKHYVGYVYTIKNTSKTPIEISNISLTDNVTGEAAYLSIRRTGLGAAAAILASGAALALPTLTISLILSAVAVPFVIVGNVFGNIGAKQESKRYDKHLKDNMLGAHESVSITLLAKRFHPPKLTVFYKNPQTYELQELEAK